MHRNLHNVIITFLGYFAILSSFYGEWIELDTNNIKTNSIKLFPHIIKLENCFNNFIAATRIQLFLFKKYYALIIHYLYIFILIIYTKTL